MWLIKDKASVSARSVDDPAYHQRSKKRGLIVYPAKAGIDSGEGDAVIIAPPFTISDGEMEELISTFRKQLQKLKKTEKGLKSIWHHFKKTISIELAIADVRDGSVLMFGGFGGVGSPPSLIEAILDSGVKELTVICNDAGFPEIGIGPLIVNKRVKTLIASHIGSNPVAGKQMTEGTLEVRFSPQGTLAERIRAGGSGLGGILTDIGIDNQMVYEKKRLCL